MVTLLQKTLKRRKKKKKTSVPDTETQLKDSIGGIRHRVEVDGQATRRLRAVFVENRLRLHQNYSAGHEVPVRQPL